MTQAELDQFIADTKRKQLFTGISMGIVIILFIVIALWMNKIEKSINGGSNNSNGGYSPNGGQPGPGN